MNNPNSFRTDNPGTFNNPPTTKSDTTGNKGGKLAPFIIIAAVVIVAGVVAGIIARVGTGSKSEKATSAKDVVEQFYKTYQDGDPVKAYSEYTLLDEDFYNEYLADDDYDFDEACENNYSKVTNTYGDGFTIEITDISEEKMSDSELEDLKDDLEEYGIDDIDEAYVVTVEATFSGDKKTEDSDDEWAVVKRGGEYKIVPEAIN